MSIERMVLTAAISSANVAVCGSLRGRARIHHSGLTWRASACCLPQEDCHEPKSRFVRSTHFRYGGQQPTEAFAEAEESGQNLQGAQAPRGHVTRRGRVERHG